jgi:hypothetical protein
MPTAKQKHLRIVCPHCGKRVSLPPPRRLGFVKPVPCPSCRIPIQPAHIKAQTEAAPEPAEEAPAGASESSEEGVPAAEGDGN